MASIEFTDDDMAALKTALGWPAGTRDPDAADVIVVLAAEVIITAEAGRWYGLDCGP